MSIKATIWDFSGVIRNPLVPDPHAALAKELGIQPETLSKFFNGTENALMNLGEESELVFYHRILKELGLIELDMGVFKHYFYDMFRIDQDLINYIRQSRPFFKTALCSNFSTLLRGLMRDEWKIEDAFDVIVISSEVKLLKPYPEIYQFTLDRLGIKPEEAIFIDDQAENITGAEIVGIAGILFKNTPQAIADIDQIVKQRVMV
jgi:epoxide hydrolase-like predicted phosphatase